ncbi:hypothetical protein [Methylobacterium indicum]|uniref:hypothetical protein n=1 Tax=Methylobacterium indicum TaxID=1775910 RepID=UPI003C6D6054
MLAREHMARHTPVLAPGLGLGLWFDYQDHRLDEAAASMGWLGVTDLRTGLSFADSFRFDALDR